MLYSKTMGLNSDLLEKINDWASELGFSQVGISDVDLSEAEGHLKNWIAKGFHADMDFMHKHGSKRTNPQELVEGTVRVISLRFDYFYKSLVPYQEVLKQKNKAAISRYAMGKDYHKIIRKKLKFLAEKIKTEVLDMDYRVFTDSAPVMEKAIAEKAGLGWIGKHSNLINSQAGSYFFLGEIYTNIPLPVSEKATFHCGTCTKCIDACPTKAIVAPFQVDSRRCISYLTIENKGEIPEEFHEAMGNRIYGCDDCQMVCPWNKFTCESQTLDFMPRHQFDEPDIDELLSWDEETFLKNTEGSPIRRIGFKSWQRNLRIAKRNSEF
ncbi:MAG: tRNA epoxyqueuosine(34) reductase QueG [Xanthomonadales bacterium]|nr:tRNA epoxyqueuosine(34) reductase QueG [Xanthomonadales bacterium]